uniref:SPK domain-containing protein n=1 Tax=Caenorhabditis japonica TaxID=281687 RepID=A0A8R1IFU5_CAEJA
MDNPTAEEDELLQTTKPKDLLLPNLEEKIKIETPDDSDDELFANALPSKKRKSAVKKDETKDSDDNEQSINPAALTWHQTRAISDDVKYRTTQDYFTYQDSLSIYTFLLDEIRSHSSERLGRVAKRRVVTGDANLWARYKRDYCGRREIESYRQHFRAVSPKLNEFQGLSELEKLDLFYALDIKVPKTIRSHLVDLYEVEFNKDGIIIGSPRMPHWDLVHPDTDREDEPTIVPNKGKVTWLRVSEREDGIMWQYLLDFVIKKGDCSLLTTRKFWEEFKNDYEGQGDAWKRVPETYRGRYAKFLAPNLHRMPFDAETKAALYLGLKIPVDNDYREE